MMLMPSSLCHGRDHAVIRSMLICIDPCSHNDHSAISCQHKAQAAMILSHMLPGFILTRGLMSAVPFYLEARADNVMISLSCFNGGRADMIILS